MIKQYLTVILILVIIFGCSKSSEVSNDGGAWDIDPAQQKFSNPILALSVQDSQLLVVGSDRTTILDSFLDSSRSGITLSGYNYNSHYRKPISSNRFIYSYSINSEEILVDGWKEKTQAFLLRNAIEFRDSDSLVSGGYLIFTPESDNVFGAVSEDDYLMTALIQKPPRNDSTDICGDDGVIVISKIGLDTSWGYGYSKLTMEYENVIPFQVRTVNNLKYYDQYFYVSTQNGILRIDKRGSSREWFLHIKTDCAVTFPNINLFTTEITDSLRHALDSLNDIWYDSGDRKNIIDFEILGDSIYALQDNGTLWISPNKGVTWSSISSTPLDYRTRLVKTNSFFGAVYGSQLFKIRIDKNDIIEANTATFSNVLINDVAEFQGRLYIATDGGLYSKNINEIEYQTQ